MRGLRLVLLAVLLCSDHALSLQCYFCGMGLTAAECPVMTCGREEDVCFKATVLLPLDSGAKVSVKQGGCAASCEGASEMIQTMTPPGPGRGPMHTTEEGRGALRPRLEVQGLSCCEKDLCNGVSGAGRSLWALTGGLLLSLGPALLWALL